MQFHRWLLLASLLSIASACRSAAPPTGAVVAPAESDVRRYEGPPTTPGISSGDLKTRLYVFADDSMRGRAAGTADNLRGTAYIEREVRRLGLEPAGVNGTYFQDVPLASGTGAPRPARNVIAIIRGTDPRLRGQYVALGAHNDHEPVERAAVDHDSVRAFNIVVRPGGAESPRPTAVTPAQRTRIRAMIDSMRVLRPARLDAIYNGADDDGTGSMALLEIAEAFAAPGQRPRRSLIFVWHTAEELGLRGSAYFTDNPTVPLDSIVAQLNIDMIGRGGRTDAVGEKEGARVYGNPDYVEVIGSRRLSTELGEIVEAVNRAETKPLSISYELDANGEPHQYYCRSDHYMYARHGIPIAFFFTNVHHDYHQVTDEPQYIDYTHYARIVRLVHGVTKQLVDLDHRPRLDGPKPNPQGSCVQ